MQIRCSAYCLSTVVMLVVLRLTVGWHFFSEGSKHLTEAHWSSEGFLRSAKGPLAPMYQKVLPPGDYNLAGTLQSTQEPEAAADSFAKDVTGSWQKLRADFAVRHKLSDEQKAAADKIGERRQSLFDSWLEETRTALAEYQHDWQRLTKAKASPSAAEVPFEKKRNDEAQAKLAGQASGWVAHIKGIEREMANELDGLLTDDQRTAARSGGSRSSLEKVDLVMKYGIAAIGVCLVLGLFTRLASLLGGLFLLSVVASQPPWLTGTVPTYPQLLEMLVLFTLATLPVGRWCGLDFFLHYLFVRPCCSAKGKTDESHS